MPIKINWDSVDNYNPPSASGTLANQFDRFGASIMEAMKYREQKARQEEMDRRAYEHQQFLENQARQQSAFQQQTHQDAVDYRNQESALRQQEKTREGVAKYSIARSNSDPAAASAIAQQYGLTEEQAQSVAPHYQPTLGAQKQHVAQQAETIQSPLTRMGLGFMGVKTPDASAIAQKAGTAFESSAPMDTRYTLKDADGKTVGVYDAGKTRISNMNLLGAQIARAKAAQEAASSDEEKRVQGNVVRQLEARLDEERGSSGGQLRLLPQEVGAESQTSLENARKMLDAEENRKLRQIQMREASLRMQESAERFRAMREEAKANREARLDKTTNDEIAKYTEAEGKAYQLGAYKAIPAFEKASVNIDRVESAIQRLDIPGERKQAQLELTAAFREFAKSLNSGALTDKDVSSLDPNLTGGILNQADNWARRAVGLVMNQETAQAFLNQARHAHSLMKAKSDEAMSRAIDVQRRKVESGLASPDMAASALYRYSEMMTERADLNRLSEGIRLIKKTPNVHRGAGRSTLTISSSESRSDPSQPAQYSEEQMKAAEDELARRRSARVTQPGQ